MKNIAVLFTILTLFVLSCNTPSANDSPVPQKQSAETYTGIKKFFEGEILKKEITYKNGIKEGLCKNYYDDGRLKRTIWYENNIKEDTAKWFYTDGTTYRATPYTNDKIHGVQTKYYRSGRVQAELPYRHGLRTPGLKEYYENGLEVGNIPSITHTISDRDYDEDGMVSIVLKLTNSSKNVNYYYGGVIDGAFDPDKAKEVSASTGMGYVELFRTDTGGKSSINVVAVYTTKFRNKEIIIKKIKLPYNNLK